MGLSVPRFIANARNLWYSSDTQILCGIANIKLIIRLINAPRRNVFMLKYGRSNPITYSQYFLAKRHIAESLVEKIPRDTLRNHSVIEIGPGTGRLTDFLVASKNLTLIEVDYNFWKRLKEKYSRDRYIKVLCGDFMDFQLPNDLYVVVSNLPYFLARNMINKLLNAQVRPKAMFFIVQKEVFDEYKRKERELNISVRLIQRLKRVDFVPMPKVESVFIEIVT